MTRALPQIDGVAVEHSTVDAGGLAVHVAQAGDGDPIVLLHGWPQNWWAWRHLIGELAQTRRVICPDLRGFGWTDAPPAGYEKRQLSRDLIATLDALGHTGPIDLVGHDWGALTGFLTALEQPQRVRRFAMVAFPHPWTKPDLRALPGLAKLLYQPVVAAPVIGERLMRPSSRFVAFMLRNAAGRRDVWTDAELAVFVDQWGEPARARASALIYRTWVAGEMRGFAGREFADAHVEVPIRFIYGTRDPIADIDQLARGIDAHTDDGAIVVIDDAGHWIPDEKPDELLGALQQFMG